MFRDHWRKDRFTVALVAIAVVGLAWRIAYVVALRHRVVVGDGFVYHLTALDLVNGVGFYNPATGSALASHPPVWPIVLAGPSLVGLKSWLSHQLFGCLVGTATIVMTGLAGRAAFGRRVGVIAAALAATYPMIWVYERPLLSESLVLLGTATMIWLAYRFRAKPGLGLAIGCGAMVGMLAMTAAELILITVLLVLPLIVSAREVPFKRRLVWLSAAAIACLVVVVPWGAYNSTRFAKPVPFSTALGAELVQGNCGPAYHGKLLGYYDLGCLIFVKNISPDYSVADGQYRKKAFTFIDDNKSRVPIVMAARVGRTFGVFRPAQQMHLEAGETRTPLWVLQLGFVSYWLLLPFAAAGIVLARRRRIAVFPLLAFPVEVLVAVVPTIGSVRYRAPAEITLVLLAALGICGVIDVVRRRRVDGTGDPTARAARTSTVSAVG